VPDTLVVLIDGALAGEVARDRVGGQLRFTYDDGHRGLAGATRLSASMPLVRREHPDEVVRNYMWGLLPDNERVIRRWAGEFQVSPSDPFGLLANTGEDCAGAVQFARPERVDEASKAGGVKWTDEAEVADRLRALRADGSAWRPQRTNGLFSLAGAQSKFALFREGGKWGEPYGRMPTTHIIKPGIPGIGDHAVNEHICMTTARNLGLSAAFTELVVFEDQPAVVVERFDRVRQGDAWRRVHQEDACQALGISPTAKYQSEGGPGAADISALLRSVVQPADQALVAVSRFGEALAFNWLVGGTDAHAKNYALLYSGPVARMAPLYDIASTLPYVESSAQRGHYDQVRMAMKIGGKYRSREIDAGRWRAAAAELGTGPDLFIGRITDLAERLPDALADACSGVMSLRSSLPEQMLESVRRAQKQMLTLLRTDRRSRSQRPPPMRSSPTRPGPGSQLEGP
jgi:serine/threonine-protein kinase HipA